jgi:hypothetical protein
MTVSPPFLADSTTGSKPFGVNGLAPIVSNAAAPRPRVVDSLSCIRVSVLEAGGKTRLRQLEKMAPRISVKELAEEIADRILSGEDDQRIKRLEDGSVKVLVSKIIPIGSGFQRTVSGRRKRLIQYLGESLSHHGWLETASNVFKLQPGPSASM